MRINLALVFTIASLFDLTLSAVVLGLFIGHVLQ
jgi:hypothetical protein